MLTRAPRASLRPFVRMLWLCDESAPRGTREWVLPTGSAHVVFRFNAPLRVYDGAADRYGRVVGHAVLGGPRTEAYLRDVSRPVTSVGAVLAPGAVPLLAGERADVLAHRHTPLLELWGRSAGLALEQVHDAETPEQRLTAFESLLGARLPPGGKVHPAVAHAVSRFEVRSGQDAQTASARRVAAVVEETGYSHRRFGTLFRHAVGLTPMRYCRVMRFQAALEGLAASSRSLVEVALAAGYADQAHLSRDFREFAGMAPSAYRRSRPADARHVAEAPRSGAKRYEPL